jgi:HEAT repeat protein
VSGPGSARALAILLALLLPALAEEAPPVDKLIEQLSARENAARREAAYQIDKLGPAAKPAIPALIKALSDPDKQVWSIAVGTLAKLGPEAAEAIPALMESLDSRKNRGPRDRDKRQILMRSAHALTRIGPAASPPLLYGLNCDDGRARAGSAKALGGMGAAAHDAIPGLIANLRRDQPDERRETIEALALIGRDSVPALGEALGSPEAPVRTGAALAIALLGRDAQSLASKVADATAKETDPAARAALLAAVPKVGVEPARAVELLIAGVRDDHDQVRHGAINAIYVLRGANDVLMPALLALVRDPNPTMSERGAAVLGRLGPAGSPAVPALLEVMRQRTPPPPVFLEALGQIGPAAVPGILSAVEGESPDVLTREHWSVKCLQTIGGGTVATLAGALTNPKISIRLVAARGLGELGPVAAPAIDAQLNATSDADPRVRATALAALVSTRVKTLAAISRIEMALKDPAEMVRVAAAQLVPPLGDQARPLAPALLTALGDHGPAVRLAVIQALAALGPAAEPAVGPLLQLLPTIDADGRARVFTVFAAVGPNAKAALPEVQRGLHDPEPAVRAAAIGAFGKIENPNERLPVLLAGLDDPTPLVRKTAARELAAIGDRARDAAGRLTAMLQREEERDVAFETLRQINVRSVPDLVTLLSDRDLTVKVFATQRLGRLGPEARDAVPALEAILNGNERGELKKNVAEALKRIKP